MDKLKTDKFKTLGSQIFEIYKESKSSRHSFTDAFFHYLYHRHGDPDFYSDLFGLSKWVKKHKLPTMSIDSRNILSDEQTINIALMYSDKFIVTVDSFNIDMNWDYEEGTYTYYDMSGMQNYIQIIEKYLPLIENGYMLPVPLILNLQSNDGQGDRNYDLATDVYECTDVSILDSNYSSEVLGIGTQKFQSRKGRNLFWPMIKSTSSIETVMEIKERYGSETQKYMRQVKKLLKGQSVKDFQETISEIDEQVILLQEELERYSKRYKLASIEIAAQCLTAGLLLFSSFPIPKELLLLFSGANTGSKVYNYFTSKYLDFDKIKRSPYYVPCKVKQSTGE